jgi:ketosteroid isomerase-like protein
MKTALSGLAGAYVDAVNAHDAAAYLDLFTPEAVVDDAGREFRGREAIRHWSESDIFAVDVTFEVLDLSQRDGETVVTTKVDGKFDRTGLPDPVIITHQLKADGEKIAALTCRLAP